MINVMHEGGLDKCRQSVRSLRRIYHGFQEDRDKRLDLRVADDFAELLEGLVRSSADLSMRVRQDSRETGDDDRQRL